MTDDDSIFQRLWGLDQENNGIKALWASEERDGHRRSGYVTVCETGSELFGDHFIPESKRKTYDLSQKLFDNYNPNPFESEKETGVETSEQEAFVRALVETELVKHLAQHLKTDADSLSAEFKELLFGTFGTRYERDLSFFEHVFVGEGVACLGGYHYWYKYLDDQRKGRILRGKRMNHSPPTPHAVTMTFCASLEDADHGGVVNNVRKSIGGFFIGCSPEFLVAVAYLLSVTESRGKRHILVDGCKFELKLETYRQRKSTHVRSFYPIYR
jgi:poly(U)-specific endoribonuclease